MTDCGRKGWNGITIWGTACGGWERSKRKTIEMSNGS